MKTTVQKETIEKAKRLAVLIESRKTAEKEEKELKEFFKQTIGADGSLQVGDWLVIVSEKSRTDLDKKALVVEYGDKIKAFEKTTTYSMVEVKIA